MDLFKEKLKNVTKNSCIYLIVCDYNNKRYIGSAISFRKRLKEHRNSLLKNQHHCSEMQNCYNKHSNCKWTIEIVENFERTIEYFSKDYKEVLLKREEYWIQKLKPEFNSQLYPYTSFGNFKGGNTIYQYDLNGKFLKKWNSSAEVERELGFNPENGLRNQSAGGYQWNKEFVERMPKYKQRSGEYGYKECSLYDLNGNLLKTFKGIRLLVAYLWGENSDMHKWEQFIKHRLQNDKKCSGFMNKYRVALGHEPILNNKPNKTQLKKFIVQQFDISDLNTPINIWENINVAESNLNVNFTKVTINNEECYKCKNIILKRL